MAAGRFSLVCSAFSLLILAFSGTALRGQDILEPDVENSRYQIEGIVNANAVFVRSGPSDNHYATMQINKNERVTVVGERFTWLKIIPPEGSFCYVAKAYVNRTGDGSVGQSTGTPYVRVGSSLNMLNTQIATKLVPNQRVEIVGEHNEYFKIKPPSEVFYYINKQYVDPIRQLPAPGHAEPENPQLSQGPTTPPTTQPQADEQQAPIETSLPPVADNSNPARPATQPVADAEAEFDRLEQLYSQASQRPLDEQPIAELLSGYEKMATGQGLPESLRRIAEYKTNILKGRAKMQEDYLGVKKSQEDLKAKSVALKAEAEELKERIETSRVKLYTAVGMLRTSSLQFGPTTLYRLTDPANGRTVVYLRSEDNKLGQRLGEFVGVRGDVSVDAQRNMTIISPRDLEAVDPAKFGQSVAAQYAPPSLMPGIASGSDTTSP